MSVQNPVYNVKAVPCHAGAQTASSNGKSIDALGCASVAFIYQFGTTTTGTSGTVTLSVEESDDDSSFTAITGATTAALTTDSGGMNAKRYAIGVSTMGRKRYYRGVVAIAGTVSTGATGPLNNAGVMLAGNLGQSLTSSSYNALVFVV